MRSCDINEVANGVLNRLAEGRVCVFNDVLERLAPEGRDWLRMQMEAFEMFTRDSLLWQRASENIKAFIEGVSPRLVLPVSPDGYNVHQASGDYPKM